MTPGAGRKSTGPAARTRALPMSGAERFQVPPMTDADLMIPTSRANPAASPRRCRRHAWSSDRCTRCGRIRDAAASRRGRNNRARGNAIEREIGRALGLRRVGQYGGPDDLTSALFAAQVKSGASFSERYWSWLAAVPTVAGQTPLLVVTDAPGPGHPRRAVVVLRLEDWRELHGQEAQR